MASTRIFDSDEEDMTSLTSIRLAPAEDYRQHELKRTPVPTNKTSVDTSERGDSSIPPSASTPILELPNELLLQIAQYLQWLSSYALRSTCRRLCNLRAKPFPPSRGYDDVDYQAQPPPYVHADDLLNLERWLGIGLHPATPKQNPLIPQYARIRMLAYDNCLYLRPPERFATADIVLLDTAGQDEFSAREMTRRYNKKMCIPCSINTGRPGFYPGAYVRWGVPERGYEEGRYAHVCAVRGCGVFCDRARPSWEDRFCRDCRRWWRRDPEFLREELRRKRVARAGEVAWQESFANVQEEKKSKGKAKAKAKGKKKK